MTIQLQNLRVLIVEDNQPAAILLKKVLAGLGIHQVFHSADGREAQQFLDAARNMVDVIICDWEMPNMTGIELLQQVRMYYPNIPFIMLTGNADPESVETAARYKVDGYIKKPYPPQKIADHLTILVKTLMTKSEFFPPPLPPRTSA